MPTPTWISKITKRMAPPRISDGEIQGLGERKKRILGALLGVHAGDSLGATLEFVPWEKAVELYPNGLNDIIGGGAFNWPAGHATDDTDLTRAVLLAYSKKRPDDTSFDVVKVAADIMLDWKNGNWPGRRPGYSPVDIGGATQTGLRNYEQTNNPRRCGAGQGSAGNGSLMRCIPTALFTSDPEQRSQESMEISAVTHDDNRCTISCAAYNTIVASLVNGDEPTKAVADGLACARTLVDKQKPAYKDEAEAVLKAIELGQTLKPQQLVQTGPRALVGRAGGYVLESLTLAIAAVLDQRPLVQVLTDIVMLGADADTNGAIAGGLLGARDGIEAIPKAWREKLQFAEEFIRLGSVLE